MYRVPRYKYYFAVSDLIILSAAFIFSANIFSWDSGIAISRHVLSVPALLMFVVLSSSIIFVFEKYRLYEVDVILKRGVHLTALIRALLFATAATALIIVLFYLTSASIFSLEALVFIFSAWLFLYILRIEFYSRIIPKMKNKSFRRNIIIAGAGRYGREIAEKLSSQNPYGINILGFLDDNIVEGTEIVNGKKILGQISRSREITSLYQPDEIIIAINNTGYEQLLGILDSFEGTKTVVKLASEKFGAVAKNFGKKDLGGISFINIYGSEKNPFSFIAKRVIDIAGAATGLLVLSPFLIVLVLMIKLSSPGPVMFRQTRIGYKGKAFSFYKFRSMYTLDGEDEDRKKMMLEFMKNNKPKYSGTKIINDKRVTWIGRFIRKTSLDELPQLFNVLKGDMSLVGPRPCLPYEYENYENWQKRRVEVMPGCTGVWQISGRSSVSFNDSVLLDLYYVKNMSLLFDLKILLMTIPVMFFSKGGK